MSKYAYITLLGLFVALVPFLGFPGVWKTFFIVISGLAIAFISLTSIARRRKKLEQRQQPRPQEHYYNQNQKEAMHMHEPREEG